MKFIVLFLAICLLTLCVTAQEVNPLEGRWDIEMDFEGKKVPSWLEIRHSGHATLVGRFVFAFGSARPIAEIVENEGSIGFAIPRQWEPEGGDMEFNAELIDSELIGTMTYVDGKQYNWKASRAPDLIRTSSVKWENPIVLFNGSDLSGWHAEGENQWVVENGILKSPQSGSNLISDEKFTDFKAHIEFRYPKGSNSGVYLRGRYEVQIADNIGLPASDIYFSGIYGFLEPNENVAKAAGEWQTYDITLIGRRVTVVANGKTVINDQTIPGITGGAIDSKEGEPGPFLIQGDHGPIEFRKFVVTPVQ
ncbi:3-keto-disaccharide hydrolase [Croceitalea rosinachiae]|uniref:DUF1080 domain-containing protein n=1 Tax=Croceitalea rosinachiae TaxID=3075596 RepID=A0ABU3ABL5_9FLAO|nr:DUF1080 domain-containing protein [Croceitalea sp. F388]MDT0607555.1 DUF1080 domain-containing protein [Croceitalea sp. F388]